VSKWGSYKESEQARAKRLARMKAYRLAHPDLIQAQAHATYERTKERVMAYRAAHKDEIAAYHRAYRVTHLEERRAAARARQTRPEQRERERIREAARRAKPDYNHKQAARQQVYQAKKKGLLVPTPCFCCGDPKVHAHHHNGYDHPLDVVWLCSLHHAYAHAGLL